MDRKCAQSGGASNIAVDWRLLCTMNAKLLTNGAQARWHFRDLGLVRPERFELPASWFVARRSIQLSYGRKGQNSDISRRLPGQRWLVIGQNSAVRTRAIPQTKHRYDGMPNTGRVRGANITISFGGHHSAIHLTLITKEISLLKKPGLSSVGSARHDHDLVSSNP
jgi:hypothetical protein